MQIKLTPVEITEALIAHLRNKGLDVDTKPVSFVFYNRRTKGGVCAEATIGEEASSEPVVKVPTVTPPPMLNAVYQGDTSPVPTVEATYVETTIVEVAPENIQPAQPTSVTSLFG
jgi:hypothetical protein